jgi:glycosyltransferase involved in cell wall biosynthesis
MNQPKVSFIVPCYNSESTIAACLESIFSQTLSPELYEVLVIDNGSSDHTLFKVEKFPVLALSEPLRGPSFARNAGISKARGEYLAFVDSDVILDPDWAENLLEEMGDYFDGAQGQIIPSSKTNGTRWLDVYRFEMAGLMTKQTFLNLRWFNLVIPLLNTAACMYRASAVRKVGGFNERLRRCEDNDLTEKIIALGGSILGTTKVKASVYYSPGIFAYLKRSFDIGFWKERQNQVSGRRDSLLFYQSPPIGASWSIRSFAISNIWMRQIGKVISTFLFKHEPANTVFALTVAARDWRERFGIQDGPNQIYLTKGTSAIALSEEIYLSDQSKTSEVIVLKSPIRETFLGLFQKKRLGSEITADERDLLNILIEKGLAIQR